MVHLCRSPLALVISAVVLAPLATAAVRDDQTDVTFKHVSARAAIEQLARSLEKSVVFDIDFHDEPVDFGASRVTHARALEQLLQHEGLFSVEVEGVLIVAPDAAYERNNYSPERIAACRVANQEAVLLDVSFHATPVNEILKAIARLLLREPAFRPEAASVFRRRYSFDVRNVTHAEALAIVCLATHLAVRDDGRELVFTTVAMST